MKARFTKMHACGNDYIYFNCFNQNITNPEGLAIRLSDRHYSVGGDGVILVCPSDVADAKMRMFNLDGSEGKMCGNGIRCVGKFLYDHNLVQQDKKEITIETLSGIKKLHPYKQNNEVTSVRVDMGKAELFPEFIPVLAPGNLEKIVNMPVTIGNKNYHITCVSMGNPHCVVFCDNIFDINLEEIGPLFENNEMFPERINTEFVRVIDKNVIQMRVWERGSGETYACGTGACAVAVAAVENGYCDKDKDILVKLKGGNLTVRYTDQTVYMTGEAVKVFEGDIEI